MTDQKFARVPATMGREGWRRDAPHTATLGGLTGRGTSQARALEDLASLISDACQRGDTSRAGGDGVTFAYDAANANLWVAVPDILHGGATEYVVDCSGDVPANPHGGGSRAGAARDAFAHSVGMAPLPDKAARQLPAMPAEVREMLSAAYDAMGQAGTAGDALADLADYVSAQFAPGELDRVPDCTAAYTLPGDLPYAVTTDAGAVVTFRAGNAELAKRAAEDAGLVVSSVKRA